MIIELPRGLQNKISMGIDNSDSSSKKVELNLVPAETLNQDNTHEEEWMCEKDLVLFQVDTKELEDNSKNGGREC